jgi:hypothetical protein
MSLSDLNSAHRPSGRGVRYLLTFLLVLFAGTGLWTWLTLQWGYADGTRSGVLQKFARSGWICKTAEGELAQYFGGLSPQVWHFSVRDAAVSAQIEKDVGARVQLHYTEHPGVPSTCFADTRYFVDRVTVTDPLPPLTVPTPPGAPPTATPTPPPAPGPSPNPTPAPGPGPNPTPAAPPTSQPVPSPPPGNNSPRS